MVAPGMSEENVAIVHELLDAFRLRDHEREFALLATNIVWDSSRSKIPGFAGIYYGHREVRSFWRGWLEAWEEIEFDVTETMDAGSCVVVGFQQRNKGHSSGIWTDQALWWGVYETADGKVVRVTQYFDRDEALAAAGLA